MFTLYSVDGEIKKRAGMSLKEAQEFVGGYIEVVGDVICNEDGKHLGLDKNKERPEFVGNIIVGNINRFD